MLPAALLVSVAYAANYFAGRIFFLKFLFADLQVRDKVVQWLFCVTWAAGIGLFELIICEVLGVLHHDARWAVWRFSLWALSMLIAAVLPFCLFYRVSRDVGIGRRGALISALACFALHATTQWVIGEQFGVVGTAAHGAFALEQFVGRIGLFGVAMLGVLSGFGVVNMPYKHWGFFRQKYEPAEIYALEQRLLRTLEAVLRKKRAALATPSRAVPYGAAQRAEHEAQQIATLEDFGRELFVEINAMREANERLRQSHTAKGRCLNVVGFVGCGICAMKMTLATLNIVLSRERKLDPVSRALRLISSMPPKRIEEVAQQISFVFLAVLTGFSVRGFLTNLSKLFRVCARRISTDSVVVILAEIMGLYFVAQTLLWRMNIAPKYRAIVTDALGDVKFGMFYTEFDSIFVASAWTTIVSLFLTETVSKMRRKYQQD